MPEKEKLIVIAGPTACGKTASAIALAKRINGAIISADSMQIYQYMDIGTAKATREEQNAVKHYLVDRLDPDESYSIALFQSMAKEAMKEIREQMKRPILCGGTGFYINGLIYDTDFLAQAGNQPDMTYRKELEILYVKKGKKYLHEMLQKVDLEASQAIHENNVKRVIRALEFYKENGYKISEHNKSEKLKQPVYDVKMFILFRQRQKLYEQIEARIDHMVNLGLVEEVEKLLQMGYKEDSVAMQGLGYKELVPYVQGKTSLDESIEILKKNTRHFAKRQLTWFKHQCDGIWIDIDDFAGPDEIARYMMLIENQE